MQRMCVGGVVAVLFLMLVIVSGCSDDHAAPRQGADQVTLRVVQDDAPAAPSWVAFQDGDGPWNVMSSASTGIYTAHVTNPQGRYSFAVRTEQMSGGQMISLITLYHGTVAELPEVRVALDPTPVPTPATVSGTVSNLPAGAHVNINTRDDGRGVTSFTPDYTMPARFGQHDIAAAAWGTDPGQMTKLAVLRDQLASSEHPTITANFDYAAMPATVPATITIANGSATVATFRLVTDDGTYMMLAARNGTFSQLPCSFPAAGQQAASDGYLLQVFDQTSQVGATYLFTAPGDRTVTLPAPLGAITAVMDTTGAAPMPTISWSPYAASVFTLGVRQGDITYQAYLTPNWLHGATSYTFPAALTRLDGWDANLTMQADVAVNAYVSALTTNQPLTEALTDFLRPPYPADAWLTFAQASSAPPNAAAEMTIDEHLPWIFPHLPTTAR